MKARNSTLFTYSYLITAPAILNKLPGYSLSMIVRFLLLVSIEYFHLEDGVGAVVLLYPMHILFVLFNSSFLLMYFFHFHLCEMCWKFLHLWSIAYSNDSVLIESSPTSFFCKDSFALFQLLIFRWQALTSQAGLYSFLYILFFLSVDSFPDCPPPNPVLTPNLNWLQLSTAPEGWVVSRFRCSWSCNQETPNLACSNLFIFFIFLKKKERIKEQDSMKRFLKQTFVCTWSSLIKKKRNLHEPRKVGL